MNLTTKAVGAALACWLLGILVGWLFGIRSKHPDLKSLAPVPTPDLVTGKGPEQIISSNASASAWSPSSSNPPENTNLAHLRPQDLEIAIGMNERSRNGEFILEMERPTDRKATESAIGDLVLRMSSNNAPALERIFSKLALPQEFSDQLKAHQAKIQKASLEAEMAVQQLLIARHEYDKRIRSVLDDTQYAEYREFEQRRPAAREYESLQEFSKSSGLELDPALQDQLINLISEAGAFTLKYAHGPYDGLAAVAVTDDTVIQGLSDDMTRIASNAQRISDIVREVDLPASASDLIRRYYEDRVEEKRRAIEGVLTHPASTFPTTPLVRPGQIAVAH